jgi:hypothetical protein
VWVECPSIIGAAATRKIDVFFLKTKLLGHDEQSDTTPPTGFKPKANEQEMTSKVFKFSFVYNGLTKNTVAPSVLHTHWMQAVQDA